MNWRHLPNAITVLRLLLVPPVVWFVLERDYAAALWLFAAAGFSDGLDGFLAKRFGWTSELGGILDPLADKLLMVCCVLALTAQGLVPIWLTVVVVLRDLIIVGGALAYHALFGRFEAAPTVTSKLNTLVLIIVVIAVLGTEWLGLPVQLWPLFVLSLALAALSGTGYVLHWGRRAREQWRSRSR